MAPKFNLLLLNLLLLNLLHAAVYSPGQSLTYFVPSLLKSQDLLTSSIHKHGFRFVKAKVLKIHASPFQLLEYQWREGGFDKKNASPLRFMT